MVKFDEVAAYVERERLKAIGSRQASQSMAKFKYDQSMQSEALKREKEEILMR
jgi:hypothetical protein